MLQIDRKSGVGVGTGSGAVLIYYSDGAFRTYSEVLYFSKLVGAFYFLLTALDCL